MKKILLIFILLMPLGAIADEGYFHRPIIWLFGENANLKTMDQLHTGFGPQSPYKPKAGFGMSNRFNVGIFDLYLDLGAYGSGKASSNMKFSTWSFELNLIRQFSENQYIFLGPSLTLWDIPEYDDADPAIGVNFGHGITVDQNAISKLLFEYGFKIYRGTLTRISPLVETEDEISFRSLSFFVKFGLMIDFLSE